MFDIQIKKLLSWFTTTALNFLFKILTNFGEYVVVNNGNILKSVINYSEILFLTLKSVKKSVIIFGI
jgi:hypothetical protein